jgi:hypothetical protein
MPRLKGSGTWVIVAVFLKAESRLLVTSGHDRRELIRGALAAKASQPAGQVRTAPAVSFKPTSDGQLSKSQSGRQDSELRL